jgi:hypothetical protein
VEVVTLITVSGWRTAVRSHGREGSGRRLYLLLQKKKTHLTNARKNGVNTPKFTRNDTHVSTKATTKNHGGHRQQWCAGYQQS